MNFLASSPAHTLIIERSPPLSIPLAPPEVPNCLRIGRALQSKQKSQLTKSLKKQGESNIYEPREQIQFGIQAATYTFEEKDTQDHIDEIAFEADVVASHHAEDFVQDIADLDVSEGESAALDA
jgi:hypothetical protein